MRVLDGQGTLIFWITISVSFSVFFLIILFFKFHIFNFNSFYSIWNIFFDANSLMNINQLENFGLNYVYIRIIWQWACFKEQIRIYVQCKLNIPNFCINGKRHVIRLCVNQFTFPLKISYTFCNFFPFFLDSKQNRFWLIGLYSRIESAGTITRLCTFTSSNVLGVHGIQIFN